VAGVEETRSLDKSILHCSNWLSCILLRVIAGGHVVWPGELTAGRPEGGREGQLFQALRVKDGRFVEVVWREGESLVILDKSLPNAIGQN